MLALPEGQKAIVTSSPHRLPSDVGERFANGDVDAFEILFRAYHQDVYRWILRIVRDSSMAEDLVIETFWRIHRHHARFDPEREFGPWARRIGTNVALKQLRRQRMQLIFSPERLAVAPVDKVWDSEVNAGMRRALDLLPPKLRLTVTLAVIEQVPYSDIADATGVPVGTIKARVFRALRLMRKHLRKWGIEP
jgi:RNA polymerase sigma-70 factor (ECF subfamily)